MNEGRANYAIGDIFGVINDAGKTVGVCLIVGRDGRGCVIGRFYRSTDVVENWNFSENPPDHLLMFGDLGIISGDWPDLGRIDNGSLSSAEEFSFVRRSMLGVESLVTYDRNVEIVRDQRIEKGGYSNLPTDELWGYGAVAELLSDGRAKSN